MDLRLWAVSAFAVSVTLSAQTSDRARTEAQSRRVGERLQTLQQEADALATQERTLLTDLRRLEVERDLKTEQVKQAETDAEQLSREQGTLGNQIDALESQDVASRPALEARMAELYKLGSAGYVRMLMNVADLREFGRAYRMVSALATLDRQRAAEHQQNLAAMKSARAALEQRTARMAKLHEDAIAGRAAAERAATARARLIAQIDARRDLTAQLAGELVAAQQHLQQTLGAISSGAPRAEADATALPIRPFRGDLDWPVTGRILTRFSAGAAANAGGAPLQNGMQIAAQEGSLVRAVHEGTVAFAGPFTGYGNLVIIDHGANTYSLYGQLEGVSVTRGARIDRGQPLGVSGHGMLIGIPAAYFEMRVDGKPVDPLEWLKKR
jgi:septal ring factor EnvC (AmiA/AmiB activator)